MGEILAAAQEQLAAAPAASGPAHAAGAEQEAQEADIWQEASQKVAIHVHWGVCSWLPGQLEGGACL